MCGDLNINLTNFQSEEVSRFNSCLFSFHFVPLITKPTRFDPGSNNATPSTLDHIWINNIYPSKAGIILYDVSDHCPTFLQLFLPFINKNSENELHKISFRPFSEAKLENLKLKLRNTNWDLLLNDNVDRSCNTFMEYIDQNYCKCFPLKHKYISNKRIEKPWITTPVKHLINEKSNYYKRMRAGLISKETNNVFKNKVNKEINLAKNIFYRNVFNRYNKDMRKTWELIRSLTGRSSNHEKIKSLIVNGENITDSECIAEKFNDFFTSIAVNLDSQLTYTEFSPYSYVRCNISNSFFSISCNGK